MSEYKQLKNVRCGNPDPHPPHVWSIQRACFCDGEGLR